VKPTIHVTNWSSRRLHGPGRLVCIMAKPRYWERGAGTVRVLTPGAEFLDKVRDGRILMEEYRSIYERTMQRELSIGELSPGRLVFVDGRGERFPVAGGDTLCCACARDEAAAGRCHRCWAARALVGAGWRVVLDGVPLEAS
jgi:hypothetical protein